MPPKLLAALLLLIATFAAIDLTRAAATSLSAYLEPKIKAASAQANAASLSLDGYDLAGKTLDQPAAVLAKAVSSN
ncbi:MAG: hypothetical protein KDJ47_08125 [Hyphomicrobiaceae bacterium]|nr:hypothetical protein [Hyphomicrobiaceae bacterium]